MLVKKCFGQNKIFGSKIILGQKNFGSNKNFEAKKIWVKKTVGQTKFWARKNWPRGGGVQTYQILDKLKFLVNIFQTKIFGEFFDA